MRVRGGVTVVCLLVLLAVAGQARASGITNSGDDLRTGWYPGESSLAPELIEGGTVGQEWSTKVEGQVYAQPLLSDGTLLVATERNRVYGLNPASGEAKWSATLAHGTPWNPADIGCADLTPSIGVTATPVIDQSTGIAYLTHKTYASGSSGPARWWLDAIEMSNGDEVTGFPVELGGEAQNIPGLTFNAADELQRPGLLLMEGAVYAAFGSHCDHDPYQGWVFGVSTAGKVKARWAADSDGAGIWQSGAGLTSDGPGQILLSTGNGADPPPPIAGSKPPEELGQAIVRLQVQSNGTLKATDFFAPFEAQELNTWDADFGSGGVTGLPSPYFGTASLPHLAVAVGKDGYVYLLNRDHLGGYGTGPGGSDDVVERIGPNGGVWSRPGVWPGEGGWVYIPTASAGHSAGGSSGNLDVYSYALTAEGKPSLHLAAESPDAFGFSSGAPIITSNGTEPGSAVVWVIWSPNGEGKGSQLRAYATKPVSRQPVLLASWPIGQSAKFSTPGVGLGRMYVGTRDEHVLAFGSPVTPPLAGSRTEFPLTKVGSSSEKTLTLTANKEVTIEQIQTSEADFAVGSPAPSLPKKLEAGQQLTVPLKFSPTAPGPRAGTLKVSLGDGETLPFSMSGTGQAVGAKLEASPTVVAFGGTTPGHPISESILLKNVGAETLKFQSATPPSPPFELESALPTEIKPNQEVLVPVSFAPTEYGSFSGALELVYNGGEATIHLLGVASTPGLLSIKPESIDFGKVAVGSQASRSFTISNTGGLPVKINISKPPIANEFHATTSLPEGQSTIEPGETVTETVRFAPTAVGAAADEWRIAGQDASGLHEIRFSGGGTTVEPPAPGLLSIEPESIDFGRVAVGSQASRSFTISNTGGLPVKINISKPPIANEFHATTSLPEGQSTIEPGETVTETVRFAPTAVGAAADEWRIAGQDASGLHEIHLAGEGGLAGEDVFAGPLGAGLTPELPQGSVLAFKTPGFGAFLTTGALLARPGGLVHVRLHCPAQQGACAGTLALRTAKAVRVKPHARPAIVTLAAGRFAIPAGRSETVSLFLSRAARGLLTPAHVLRVRLSTITISASGRSEVVRASVGLHTPSRSAAH